MPPRPSNRLSAVYIGPTPSSISPNHSINTNIPDLPTPSPPSPSSLHSHSHSHSRTGLPSPPATHDGSSSSADAPPPSPSQSPIALNLSTSTTIATTKRGHHRQNSSITSIGSISSIVTAAPRGTSGSILEEEFPPSPEEDLPPDDGSEEQTARFDTVDLQRVRSLTQRNRIILPIPIACLTRLTHTPTIPPSSEPTHPPTTPAPAGKQNPRAPTPALAPPHPHMPPQVTTPQATTVRPSPPHHHLANQNQKETEKQARDRDPGAVPAAGRERVCRSMGLRIRERDKDTDTDGDRRSRHSDDELRNAVAIGMSTRRRASPNSSASAKTRGALPEELGRRPLLLDLGANVFTPAYAFYKNGNPVRVGIINYETGPSGASDLNVQIAMGGLGRRVKNPASVKVK
ncbi:hypothetical protein DXG01_003765 [Tephrocybe rancida]|nr:hypothetical protein DXG01_003765 [Tephrocybe rancida]